MFGRDIHNGVTQTKESLGLERFREEVRYVVVRTNKRHGDQVILNALANVQVPTFDVLHAPKMLGVVRHVGGRTIVTVTEFSD